MALDDLILKLPYELRSAKDVYLVTPDAAFFEAWRRCHPQQARPSDLRKDVLEKNTRQIESNSGHIMPIPNLSTEIRDGKAYAVFIDGRHRFLTLHQMGMQAIPCLTKGVDPDNLPSYLKPLPPEMRRAFESGQHEGTEDTGGALSSNSGFVKNWANNPHIAQMLLKRFTVQYGEEGGKWCLEHYQQHGALPPEDEIEKHAQGDRADLSKAMMESLRQQLAEMETAAIQQSKGWSQEAKNASRATHTNLRPSAPLSMGR